MVACATYQTWLTGRAAMTVLPLCTPGGLHPED